MMPDVTLIGNLVVLKPISLDYCNEKYVGWLNDNDVNKYLDTKWNKQDLESVMDFVKNQQESVDSVLFAILCKDGMEHIGNIKIGPVHPHYHYADISYFIGEKRLWGNGVASEAIGLVTKYAFENLGLHKIEAGTYEMAVGSQKALLNNGFKLEAVIKDAAVFDGEFIDVLRYYKLNNIVE